MAAFELLTAVRDRDAYANLALPGDPAAAPAARPGRRAGHRAGLRHAARAGAARRGDRRLHRPPAAPGRARRCWTRCGWAPTSCCAPGCRRTPRSTPPSSWSGSDAGTARGRVRQRRAAPGGRARRGGLGGAARARRRRRTRSGTRRSPTPTRAGSPRRSPTRWARARTDELDAALAADDARPSVHLLARPGEITAEELALVTGGEPAPYSPYGVHLEPGGGDIGELDAVREGLARGAGRGQPARGAGAGPRAALDGPGRRPLARPVRRARWQGRAAGRARRRGGRRRWTPSSRPSTAPSWCAGPSPGCRSPCTSRTAGTAPLPDGAFDRVLVDAPCTGLGALRRRPEARWRRRPEDVAGLARLQRELLTAALRHVRPGGVVAYVTCSPHLAETVGVVRRDAPPGAAGGRGGGAAVEQLDARPLPAGGAGPRAGPDGAAVAAPARHGRDVPGPAAAHRLSRA